MPAPGSLQRVRRGALKLHHRRRRRQPLSNEKANSQMRSRRRHGRNAPPHQSPIRKWSRCRGLGVRSPARAGGRHAKAQSSGFPSRAGTGRAGRAGRAATCA